MASENSLELVSQRGWRRGLNNMLDKEFGFWFRTRRWWIQALVWLGILGFLMGSIILQSDIDADSLYTLYGIFASIFPAVAVIIQMQSALVGEKASGTAAWVLSKPVTRSAFITAKMAANSLTVLAIMVVAPGLADYGLLSYAVGHLLNPLRFIGGMGVIWLSLLYYLAFTLMLGAFLKSRGGVIGIALGLLFAQQYLLGLTPLFKYVLPWTLTVPLASSSDALLPALLQGLPVGSFAPQVVLICAEIGLFTAAAIWRFNREEL